ncbi:MAG: hypothetical protein ABSB49_19225 [Polyangia bacterium]
MSSTSTSTPLAIALTLAFGWGYARVAIADVAPPGGYVVQCTVAKEQTPSSECVGCQATYAGLANFDRCDVLLSPYCFVEVCDASGGESQVWCRTKSASAPPVPGSITDQLYGSGAPDLSGISPPVEPTCAPYSPPASGNTGGCSVLAGGTPSPGLVWLLAGLAAVIFVLARDRLRRRR